MAAPVRYTGAGSPGIGRSSQRTPFFSLSRQPETDASVPESCVAADAGASSGRASAETASSDAENGRAVGAWLPMGGRPSKSSRTTADSFMVPPRPGRRGGPSEKINSQPLPAREGGRIPCPVDAARPYVGRGKVMAEWFVVGGAVRDLLLGRDAHDVDISFSGGDDFFLQRFPAARNTGREPKSGW